MDELETLQPDKELFAAIAELDAEFKQLQKEMGDAVNKEEIIQAMIENYRLKLELLETMVQSLKGEPEAEESNGKESDEYKTI
jgi:regulator of replication initiation timing